MASKKKPANKKASPKAPAKKKAAKKQAAKKQAAKKSTPAKKKATPQKRVKPKKSKAEEQIVKEIQNTVDEVKVVFSKKEDVLSELAKGILEEKLNEQANQKKIGFLKKLFGFKK